MGALDAMNPPDKCPTCGADTPAGDWKRWPVNPGVNLERELALARARIARLEEAGDEMLEALYTPEPPRCVCNRSYPCDDCVNYSSARDAKQKWQQAKEAKL